MSGDGSARILVAASSDFVHVPIGGVTTFVRNVLPSLGPTMCVVGLERPLDTPEPDTIMAGDHAVPYLSAGQVRPDSVLPQRLQVAMMMRGLRDEVRAWKPSIVYSSSPETTVVLSHCLRGTGVPIVHHMHGSATDTSYSPHRFLRNPAGTAALTWLLHSATRRSALILGVSSECADVAQKFDRPYRFMPTCVDTSLFHPAQRRPDPGSLRIAVVGRVDRVKNLPLMLQAVRVLADDGVDVSVIVAGEGPADAEVQALAVQLDLSERVDFVGPVDPQAAADIFRRSNVALLTSHFEGLPTSMLEAMATALPVVAPRLPGIERVVTNGRNGILFDEYDARVVAAALAETIDNGEHFGCAALATIRRSYAADVVGERIRDILGRISASELGAHR